MTDRWGAIGVVVLAVGVWGAPLAAGGELDAAQVLDRVQGWLDGTRDLQARFEQTLVSGALGDGLTESGRLWLQRPGRMRWDYLEPESKVALVEGETTRLYLAEDQQLWEGRLEDTESLLPVLLTGEERLDELFESTLEATPKIGGRGAYRLRLAPRSTSETFQTVVLTLQPPRFAIERAEVLDAAGNQLLYRFSGIKRNRGLKDSDFYFEPPPGTEIVAQAASR
jgi:outer membrane lipoprotein carrier protein